MSTYRHTCDTAQVPPAPLAIAPQWWVGSVLRFQKCQRARHEPGFPEHGQALPNFHPPPTPLPLNTGGRAVQRALDNPAPRHGPPHSAARGKRSSCRGAPPVRPTFSGLCDSKGQPMIKLKPSQKSITPPNSEAYNEEGEEEKDDDEEEEPVHPTKHQHTCSVASKSRSLGKGKGKARANTPAPSATSSRFPAPVCKTHRKNKKSELPAYVSPQPVPTMDSVTLATETLVNGQHKPTVFDTGCSNCILCNRECDHGGNELITDLNTAHADYELAREQLFLAVARNRVGAWIHKMVSSLGPYDLPRMTEIPEDLRPL
ncbi:hypothetical protein B0H14DRAFT_3471586 [Mycena olivaceomarginata]|nr:hypothetical protein B0H14DRAFT_3471586 [Mycena olivaceomarginata]